MKKGAKKAREKAGLFFDRLRSSSRSRPHSPVPPDPDVRGGPRSTSLPVIQTEPTLQLPQTASVPVIILPSLQIASAPQSMPADQGPILPTQFLDSRNHANPEADEAGPGTSNSEVGEVSEVPRLPSSMSLGPHGPVRTKTKLEAGAAQY